MHQLNIQVPEGRTFRTDGTLEVVDVFYTLQGEGPFAGEPAVFVRLAGCNLNCPDCDTDYTSNRRMVSVTALTNEVDRTFPADLKGLARLVVITGGEPFRQNITPFVNDLLNCGFKVQVETNGTIHLADFPYNQVTLVVSPKVGRVAEALKPHVHHLKYVITAGRQHERTKLPLYVLGNPAQVDPPWPGFRGTVWVQPADEQNDECNKTNLQAAVDACLTHGYRLSVQIHKQADLP